MTLMDVVYLVEKYGFFSILKLNKILKTIQQKLYILFKPFPTQRPKNLYCFVSCFYPCCDISANQVTLKQKKFNVFILIFEILFYQKTHLMPICPTECRLKPEWERC